jgi:hypothetical protein
MVLNFSYILDEMTLSVSIDVFPSVLCTNLSLFCRVQLLLKRPHVREIIKKKMTVLHKSEKMKKVFIKPPILAFRRDKNLKDILVHKKHNSMLFKQEHKCGTPNPYGIELFIYSGRDDFECKHRCVSVDFVYKSVFILPCSIIAKTSKNYNFSVAKLPKNLSRKDQIQTYQLMNMVLENNNFSFNGKHYAL